MLQVSFSLAQRPPPPVLIGSLLHTVSCRLAKWRSASHMQLYVTESTPQTKASLWRMQEKLGDKFDDDQGNINSITSADESCSSLHCSRIDAEGLTSTRNVTISKREVLGTRVIKLRGGREAGAISSIDCGRHRAQARCGRGGHPRQIRP